MECCTMLTVFLVVAMVLCIWFSADPPAPQIQTRLGCLRGLHMDVEGKHSGVHVYLAVPFARPPVGGALRLSAPQPVEGWEGVRDANKQPPMCVQSRGGYSAASAEMSEDCLYLNVYTPANRAADAKLPVMVWIHGGAFISGSASIYDGSVLAAYQNVVVVIIQYRLGLLGFISTGDENLPGNYGLLDQVQALRWVQEHIQSFGGDPGMVTAFGQSAGGVSVSLLLLSPLTEGLLHRAVSESGTAKMDLFFGKDPLPVAQTVARACGCSLEPPRQQMVLCIKNCSVDTFVTFYEEILFPVTVDGLFLEKTVDELYRNQEVLPVPFLTGVVKDEGCWMLSQFINPPNWAEGMDLQSIFNTLSIYYSNPIFKELLMEEYCGTGEDQVQNRNAFMEMLGDLFFVVPATVSANAHRDAGVPVFMYEYSHVPFFMQSDLPSFITGYHGDELFSVMGMFLSIQRNVTAEERELSRTVMSYWGNFARTGSPNGPGLVQWPQYGAAEEYLEIGLAVQVAAEHMRQEWVVFLTQTLPREIREYRQNTEDRTRRASGVAQ